MTGQTASYTVRASEFSRLLVATEVVRILQGGTWLTSGSLRDWPLFDLGTAAWPIVPQEPKKHWQSLPLHADQTGAEANLSRSTTYASPTVVIGKDDHMERLEIAASRGDERAFLDAQTAVNWAERPATDFLRAIHLALAAGAHMAARNLATQGTARYPDDPELEKYARVLAPPRMLPNSPRSNSGLRANRDWLMANGAKYRGQWVALRQGELLGVGDSLHALINEVGSTDGILFTKAH